LKKLQGHSSGGDQTQTLERKTKKMKGHCVWALQALNRFSEKGGGCSHKQLQFELQGCTEHDRQNIAGRKETWDAIRICRTVLVEMGFEIEKT
jgi:hypothetical protein